MFQTSNSGAGTFWLVYPHATGTAPSVARPYFCRTSGIIRRPRYWNGLPTGAGALTLTVLLNNVATPWVLVTTTNAAGMQVAGAGSIAVAQGDRIDIQIAGLGLVANLPTYTFEFWGAKP